jgi:hypothetical protein
MQVRDLIEELQRFDPRARVRIEISGTARHPSGIEVTFDQEADVDCVKSEAGEPLVVAV